MYIWSNQHLANFFLIRKRTIKEKRNIGKSL